MSSKNEVSVVGAGLMGTGIAHGFAVAGCDVLLIDPAQGALDKALKSIGKLLDEGVSRGKLAEADAQAAKARITTATTLDERLANAALLVETAVENIEIKHTILKDAAALLPSTAFLATNTSALSISEIASVIDTPGRVIGMHFFNPVPKMKLVEIIRGLETSDEALVQAIDWVKRLGKDHIVVNEAPGFTTSRMSAMMGNEAMYMLAEGVASAEDIDKSLRMAFNHPMGPLELGDLTGWDTRLRVLQYLHGVMGEKFRPCPLIIKMVKAGRHGRKVGRGVYEYDENGAKVPGSGLRAVR
ncbi:3-hydroxyacyl-CoA dehydrogenase [Sphingosinicella microcystinivorans]|nr:3-hydroxyacyl-CoA dehydrogenase [Sphingosinicella microcystinivorans]RKS86331.1 3-hydroxybutyryl-CoA dehydrogenase [Sphingosinicella microcystinivorans]